MVRLCGINVFPQCVHSLQKPFITLTHCVVEMFGDGVQFKNRPILTAVLLRQMEGMAQRETIQTHTHDRKAVEYHYYAAHTQYTYLVEAAVENSFDFLLIKGGFLDLPASVLVVECDRFAGS